jgi:acetyl-CoA carboxylase biotin carboxyl carrier protein
MEFKEIQELIKLVSKTSISAIKIKRGDFEIKITNKSDTGPASVIPAVIQPTPVAVPQPTIPPVVPVIGESPKPAAETSKEKEETASANTYVFKSPMIGTFYRKPAPDKDVFVKVGDIVKNGDVLCIIEAMKLFNEIEFDGGEGRILKILAEDSTPVEYDQPLFLIEKIH